MDKDRLFIVVGALLLIIIFALIFLAIGLDSVLFMMFACVTAVIFIFGAVAVFLKSVQLRNIKQMTHELISIAHDLEARDYSHYSADSKEFYEALAAVKLVFIQREHLRKEILEIARYVALNLEFDKTLRELTPKVAELTRSNCCAFYAVNNSSKLSLKHSIGFSKNIYSEFDLTLGEGFIGHLAIMKDVTIVYDVPDDTIYMVRTFLGKIKPRNIMVVPIYYQEQLNGVLVCASIHQYTEENLGLTEMVRYYLGVAVGNGLNAEQNKRMANELAFQNNLIQSQHEEMRNRLRDKELLVHHLVSMLDEEIVYMLDEDYRVLYWDNTARAIFGLTREEAVGRHIDHINGEIAWPLIEVLLQNNFDQNQERLEHCTWVTGRNGKKRRFEMTFLRMHGEFGIMVKLREIEGVE